jgi:hypothetical protein
VIAAPGMKRPLVEDTDRFPRLSAGRPTFGGFASAAVAPFIS